MKKALIVIMQIFILKAIPSSAFAFESKGKILIVVSSENSLKLKGGKRYPTGYYLNELIIPAEKLTEAGYDLVVANPKGNQPSMDLNSDNISYFRGNKEDYEAAKKFHANFKALKKPLKLSQVIKDGLDQYKAIFVPGGHAPMIDLMASSELGKILKNFHDNKKPTALICHGPVALAAAVKDPKAYRKTLIEGNIDELKTTSESWPYVGYKMTVFSTSEEQLAEKKLGAQTEFFPEDVLRHAGGIVSVEKEWQANAIRDRELITGQNPFSDGKLVELLLAALQENEKN